MRIRRMKSRILAVGIAVAGAGLLAPSSVLAYGGPGSIISGIGAFLAVLAALVASIFGFLWFPLKRVVRKLREGRESKARSSTAAHEELSAE